MQLPNGWAPREYQDPVWTYLTNGGRHAFVLAHRRWGKDDVAMHHTAVAAHRRIANYIHMLPEFEQARKALWTAVNPHSGMRRIDEAFPEALRAKTLDDEMFIGMKNGSTWQLAGSDRYNRIVGASFAGIVYSEYALGNPSAQGYFTPMLIENNGWELMITTPRGRNHAYAMHRHAEKEQAAGRDWYAEISPASKTGALNAELLQAELRRLQSLHGDDFGRALWMQEYECSFDAAVPGSIWGDCLDRMQRELRIGVVPLDGSVLVNTAWDLGWTDQTAIWWYQIVCGEIRILDYHEGSFKDIQWYADLLRAKAKERGFKYDTHWLPHDARARTVAAGGESIQQQMMAQDVGRIAIAKRLDHVDGIQAARATFPHVWMDAERCEKGIEVLRAYCYEWDEEKRTFSTVPKHDFASHGASAFRTLSLSWKPPKGPPKAGMLQIPTEAGSITNQSFGAIVRRHLSKARAARGLHMP